MIAPQQPPVNGNAAPHGMHQQQQQPPHNQQYPQQPPQQQQHYYPPQQQQQQHQPPQQQYYGSPTHHQQQHPQQLNFAPAPAVGKLPQSGEQGQNLPVWQPLHPHANPFLQTPSQHQQPQYFQPQQHHQQQPHPQFQTPAPPHHHHSTQSPYNQQQQSLAVPSRGSSNKHSSQHSVAASSTAASSHRHHVADSQDNLSDSDDSESSSPQASPFHSPQNGGGSQSAATTPNVGGPMSGKRGRSASRGGGTGAAPYNSLKLRRKLRKNTREKQRRTEINDQFDSLTELLHLNTGHGKIEKYTVLTEAINVINTGRRDTHTLRTERAALKEEFGRLTQQLPPNLPDYIHETLRSIQQRFFPPSPHHSKPPSPHMLQQAPFSQHMDPQMQQQQHMMHAQQHVQDGFAGMTVTTPPQQHSPHGQYVQPGVVINSASTTPPHSVASGPRPEPPSPAFTYNSAPQPGSPHQHQRMVVNAAGPQPYGPYQQVSPHQQQPQQFPSFQPQQYPQPMQPPGPMQQHPMYPQPPLLAAQSMPPTINPLTGGTIMPAHHRSLSRTSSGGAVNPLNQISSNPSQQPPLHGAMPQHARHPSFGPMAPPVPTNISFPEYNRSMSTQPTSQQQQQLRTVSPSTSLPLPSNSQSPPTQSQPLRVQQPPSTTAASSLSGSASQSDVSIKSENQPAAVNQAPPPAAAPQPPQHAHKKTASFSDFPFSPSHVAVGLNSPISSAVRPFSFAESQQPTGTAPVAGQRHRRSLGSFGSGTFNYTFASVAANIPPSIAETTTTIDPIDDLISNNNTTDSNAANASLAAARNANSRRPSRLSFSGGAHHRWPSLSLAAGGASGPGHLRGMSFMMDDLKSPFKITEDADMS